MDFIIVLLSGAVLGLLLNVALMRNRIRALERQVANLWAVGHYNIAQIEEFE